MLFLCKLFNFFYNIILKYFSAFIWFFSSVYPQMQFQIKYMWANLITLNTFIWFLSSVCIIRYGLKLSFHKKKLYQAGCIYIVSVKCVHQMWLKSNISWKKALSHWLYLYGFSPIPGSKSNNKHFMFFTWKWHFRFLNTDTK